LERNKAYIIFSQLKRDYYGPSEIEYIYLVRKALLILWRIWFYILAAVPVILLFLPLAFMLLLPNGYRYVFWVARNLWAPIVLFGSGFWIKKTNSLPRVEESAILIANHSSFMDIMLMFRMRKTPFVFVGKKELVQIPFFGYLYKRAAIMVDRSSIKSRQGVYQRAQEVIQKGYSICIFPEKEYLDETILLNSFKKGAFKLALEHGLPILPLVFLDCKRKFPWYTTYGYPGSLRVKVLEVLQVEEIQSKTIETLQKESYYRIKSTLEKDPKKRALEAIELWKKKTA
jgi:1-acyl-sn-glycerol-3-phosphate acyltransferase